MKMNMKAWAEEIKAAPVKRAFPILSFPCATLLNIPVSKLIADSEKQAQGMKLVADQTNSAASVSLMDLSVEAECFGAEVRFSESEVPTVTGQLITDMDGAEALAIPTVGSCRSGLYVDAIKKASERITDRPIFAGTIGPFSLAARLLDVSEIMMQCYDDPDMVHLVLEKATSFLIEYSKAYKAAGANGIVMAEPVAGLLSPALEAEFSSPYVKRIVDAVQDDTFMICYHNCGDNTPMMVESLLSTGAMAYHFGNSIDMKTMVEKFPSDVLVMGNVDPAGILRMGTPARVREETLRIMNDCCGHKNFVISSGCDVPPATPWENIRAFFAAVDEYYEKQSAF